MSSCGSMKQHNSEALVVQPDQLMYTTQLQADQTLLSLINEMGPGQHRAYGANSVTTGLEYHSASGLNCKPIFVSRPDGSLMQRQLACRLSTGWAFMLNVMSYNKRFD